MKEKNGTKKGSFKVSPFGIKKKNILDVKICGDPLLREKSVPVEDIDDGIMDLAASLIDTMFAFDGVGLAAPQVGRKIRMVALAVPQAKNQSDALSMSPGEVMLLPRMPLVLVNPQVISLGNATDVREEGCLSVPDIYADVERPVSMVLKTRLLDGGEITVECGGFFARVLQHEIDHLEGILFIDRLADREKAKIKSKLERLRTHGKRKGFFRRLTGK